MHLMREVQQSRQEHREAAKVSNGASLSRAHTHRHGEDSDRLFVLPVLEATGSATFNLTLNSQNAAHPVRKITLLLKPHADLGMISDLDVSVGVSSWTSSSGPFVTETISPEALPDSFENYLVEPTPMWIEYNLTTLLLDAAQYERLNMIVVSSRLLRFSKAYLRVDYDDGQVSAALVECHAALHSLGHTRSSINFSSFACYHCKNLSNFAHLRISDYPSKTIG